MCGEECLTAPMQVLRSSALDYALVVAIRRIECICNIVCVFQYKGIPWYPGTYHVPGSMMLKYSAAPGHSSTVRSATLLYHCRDCRKRSSSCRVGKLVMAPGRETHMLAAAAANLIA